ncbi:MAG: C45 family autoproteolytic acyltransferase/hydrolase [Planctomycetota bacterium]|jgi:isopenicillin-N N-acyltransferase-like protein|nr:C45 family autoproteolytic acyltransferase/hydrolase [Planctomycetota bacterium]
MYQLPLIEVAGSVRACGQAQGEAMRDLAQAFVAQRRRAAKVYLYERGSRDLEGLVALGRQCMDATEAWDPAGIEEHRGIAEGANMDAAELFTFTNMTDIRDVLLYGELSADAEGCTSLLVDRGHSASGDLIAAQTWDLNPTDIDYVVAVHRRPDTGPETWTVTCAGCQTLVGMNGDGLWVGTTNIKTTDARIGVPYLSLLHRAIRYDTSAEALSTIAAAPRAGAHTYWAADAEQAGMIECAATAHVRRDLHDTPLVQTNHCVDPAFVAMQGEEAGSSTLQRRATALARLATGNHDVASIKALFADRSDGVDSINRYAEDEQGTATNSCLVAIPAKRELHACKGPADRGEWVQLQFG